MQCIHRAISTHIINKAGVSPILSVSAAVWLTPDASSWQTRLGAKSYLNPYFAFCKMLDGITERIR